MNVPVITAPAHEAREKASAYRAQLRKRNDPEYSAAAEAYELLAQGKKLIDVGVAIREGGFDEKMRPKLAIARADRLQVEFIWAGDRDRAVFDTNAPAGRDHPQLREAVNFNRRHGRHSDGGWGLTVHGFSLVPMVPADVRPNVNLKDCHILWEVDQWADERIGAKPPTDPYLLRRLRGELFVVLAEWDLTDLEKYVMAGRARVQG
jgi:hypothetical protein